MSYQVVNGLTRDYEFELYLEALRECGVAPEPVMGGRTGVVETEEKANQILEAVRKRVPWLSWQVIELHHEPDA